MTATHPDDPRDRITRLQRQRDQAQRVGDTKTAADCDYNLGDAHRAIDEYPQARAAYQRARAIYTDLGLTRQVADCDGVLSDVHAALGEHPQALLAYQRARDVYVGLGLTRIR